MRITTQSATRKWLGIRIRNGYGGYVFLPMGRPVGTCSLLPVEANALRPSLGAFALNDSGGAAESTSDEQLALRAREQYKESGIPVIEADEVVAPHLDPDERVLWTSSAAVLRRVDVDDDRHPVLREEGPLYVTDRRLLHVGPHVESISLLDIDELSMADDRILLTLVGSRGLTLDVDAPQQLKVLIAAAKATRRSHAEG